MYYQVDENNKITAMADYKFQPDAVYTDEEIVYDYDGRLVFKHETETEKYKAIAVVKLKEKQKEELRHMREFECFRIINRGGLWYETLTDEQREVLKAWYEDWLNVTETLAKPNKPEWLK